MEVRAVRLAKCLARPVAAGLNWHTLRPALAVWVAETLLPPIQLAVQIPEFASEVDEAALLPVPKAASSGTAAAAASI